VANPELAQTVIQQAQHGDELARQFAIVAHHADGAHRQQHSEGCQMSS
jgi:hypothetical protein